jgi:hypothetical protein
MDTSPTRELAPQLYVVLPPFVLGTSCGGGGVNGSGPQDGSGGEDVHRGGGGVNGSGHLDGGGGRTEIDVSLQQWRYHCGNQK